MCAVETEGLGRLQAAALAYHSYFASGLLPEGVLEGHTLSVEKLASSLYGRAYSRLIDMWRRAHDKTKRLRSVSITGEAEFGAETKPVVSLLDVLAHRANHGDVRETVMERDSFERIVLPALRAGGKEVALRALAELPHETIAEIVGADNVTARQRFVRGRAGDKPGAGLGLPIVEEIASLFGGRLELLAGADGRGLRVRVAFGKAPDA